MPRLSLGARTLGEIGLGKGQRFLHYASLGLGASFSKVPSHRSLQASVPHLWERNAYLGGVVPIKREKHVQRASPAPGM